MEIEDLTKYNEEKNNFPRVKKHPQLKVLPASIEEINNLEKEINDGSPFPKAFREFLFIGGNYSSIKLNLKVKSILGYTQNVKKSLNERGVNIARPIAIFNQLDGYSFAFIYLDEGDDPQPWNCSTHSAYDSDDDEIIWKTPFKSFSELVNTMVELTISGLNA